MTILQKEIQKRSQAISTMGNLMAGGIVDITPENESIFQTGLVAMMEANEKYKAVQEEIFKNRKWLRKAVIKQEAAQC